MSTEPKILIVDDEEKIRWVLKKALEKKRFFVHTAESAEQALEKIRTHRYLIVFSDIFMEGMSGLELLEKAREIDPALKIAVMTAQDTMNNTIEAMRMGAYDYISKPFDLEEVYALVAKVQASRKVEAPSGDTGEPETKNFSVQAIIGKNKKIQEVFKTIGKSADSDLAVLITGESGTGKEMVAGALHNYSRRAGNPFICINCASISRELLESELFGHEKGAFTGAVEKKKGKFELAHGGTIFLDEIGDMELPLQSKILRVLQNNEFYHVGGKTPIQSDVRIIAATNQNLEEMMEQKRFREDLYHRLNVISINLPPLRERPEDVLLLANHFIKRYSPDLTRGEVYLSPEVEQFFRNYQWPGNIRELENGIKRALVLASSGPILKEHLPLHLLPASLKENELNKKLEEQICLLIRDILSRNDFKDGVIYEEVIQKIEKPLFEILLEKHSGKQIAAARELGINRNTLKRKMDAMNIQARKRRSNPEP